MAIKKDEVGVKKESPILKKRTAPEDVKVEKETTTKTSPLKKRTLPGDEPNAEKSVASILKKRELPTEETEPKEKSSLDKMRERIAAQKKLEQDMMTQQTLKNQEKVGMRNKLAALQKDLTSESEDEEPVVKTKPVIELDLKSEALETQNKKLKQDLEKAKQQLQSLLAVEYNNTKVLDASSMSLSNDFINSITASSQANTKKDEELAALKDELNQKIKDLNKQIKDQEKQIEKLQAAKEALNVDKQDAQKENKKLANQVATLTAQLSDQNKEAKDSDKLQNQITDLQSKLDDKDNEIKEIKKQLDESFAKTNEYVEKIKQLESNQSINEKASSEKADLEKQLEEQSTKIDELLMKYQVQLDEKDKEINSLRQEVLSKEKQVEELKTKVSKLPTQEVFAKYQTDCDELNKQNKQIKEELNSLKDEKEKCLVLLKTLRDEKVDIVKVLIKNGKNVSSVEKQIIEINSLIGDNNFDMNFIQEEITKYENECRIKVEDNIGQIDLGKIKELQEEISSLEFKLKENKIVEDELKEQYDRFVASEKKYISENKVVGKYLALIQEYKAVSQEAKDISIELSTIDAKNDKKAYKAKVAQSKSMNGKVSYLERQIKKLRRSGKIKDYIKLAEKIHEFESQFNDINKRNDELKTNINQKQLEINELKA